MIDEPTQRLLGELAQLQAELARARRVIPLFRAAVVIVDAKHRQEHSEGSDDCDLCAALDNIDVAEKAESITIPFDREELVDFLQEIVRNDATYYEHHQERRWDGRKPREVSDGTIWLTPKEMAIGALRHLGADVPDAIAESLGRSPRSRR